MKQITLKYSHADDRQACGGRIAFIWGLYGLAVSWLWTMAGGSAWGHLAAWVAALAAGSLLLAAGEI